MTDIPFEFDAMHWDPLSRPDTPEALAEYLWHRHADAPPGSLKEACELAPVDRWCYDGLTKWMRERGQDCDDTTALMVFRALACEPPPDKAFGIEERKRRVVAVAKALKERFPDLPLFRNRATPPGRNIADIIHEAMKPNKLSAKYISEMVQENS